MKTLLASNIGWILPAAGLIALALPRFEVGIARERAFPVPVYLARDVALPTTAYQAASRYLRPFADRDPAAAAVAAEAELRAGQASARARPLLLAAVQRAPASARTWTLLAAVDLDTDAARAADELRLALMLAPRDFTTASLRLETALDLWSKLDPSSRKATLAQLRQCWQVPALRSTLLSLLQRPDGPARIAEAFAGEADELRALNRWLAAQARRAGASP